MVCANNVGFVIQYDNGDFYSGTNSFNQNILKANIFLEEKNAIKTAEELLEKTKCIWKYPGTHDSTVIWVPIVPSEKYNVIKVKIIEVEKEELE